jgi:hypothetical protein
MSDSKDWYSKRLGNQQPAQRVEPTPQFAPMPSPYQRPAYGEIPAQQYVPQHEPPQWDSMDKDERRQFLLNNPKPGAGNRDAQTCPECGSGNLFSRRNTSGLRTGGTYPAPECFDCGWPLVQAGSHGGAIGNG